MKAKHQRLVLAGVGIAAVLCAVLLAMSALKEQADTSLRAAAQEDLADREVTIMGDKGTPFTVLKRVMATATAADYGKVSLAVLQKEAAAGAGA